jgi:hypothetical protein
VILAVMILTCIRKKSGLTLDRDTDYPDRGLLVELPSLQYQEYGHYRLLPHPFQFTIIIQSLDSI